MPKLKLELRYGFTNNDKDEKNKKEVFHFIDESDKKETTTIKEELWMAMVKNYVEPNKANDIFKVASQKGEFTKIDQGDGNVTLKCEDAYNIRYHTELDAEQHNLEISILLTSDMD